MLLRLEKGAVKESRWRAGTAESTAARRVDANPAAPRPRLRPWLMVKSYKQPLRRLWRAHETALPTRSTVRVHRSASLQQNKGKMRKENRFQMQIRRGINSAWHGRPATPFLIFFSLWLHVLCINFKHASYVMAGMRIA